MAAVNHLSEDDLVRVLTEPRSSLCSQYETLFGYSGVEIRFTLPALRIIAKQAIKKQTGARGLRRIMEQLLLDAMYEVPQSGVRYVAVTKEVADRKISPLYFSRGQVTGFFAALSADEGESSDTIYMNPTDSSNAHQGQSPKAEPPRHEAMGFP